MNGSLLARLAGAGATVRRGADGAIRLRPSRPLPADLLAEARAARNYLALLLAEREAEDAEAEAMRQHYAAPAGCALPPDPMKAGLLRGFWTHQQPNGSGTGQDKAGRQPAPASPEKTPPPPMERMP